MASTRSLLVLMLFLLPRLQTVKSGFFVQMFQRSRSITSPVVIPKDGVYLVSIIIDPCVGCYGKVKLFCQRQGIDRFLFTTYSDDIYSNAEVAVGLYKNDKLSLRKIYNIGAWSSFSVIYVAELDGFYFTVRNDLASKSSPLAYTSRLWPVGWGTLYKTLNIPITGIYWVTVRVRPFVDPTVTVDLRAGSTILFVVYVEERKTVSASGAFHLGAGSSIKATTRQRHSYDVHCLLSVVYLAGNKKPNTYPFQHLAFTGRYYRKCGTGNQALLKFDLVKTNHGYMYRDGYTEIRRTGTYMISIRLDPESKPTITVSLYVNGKSYWVVNAERSVPTGATISVFLQAVSYLEVRCTYATTIGPGNMFSVAFIQP